MNMTINTKGVYQIKDSDLFFVANNTAPASTQKQYVLTIKDLPGDDKPREKLLDSGPHVLSTQELLAIVLTTGTKKEELLSMSKRLIKDYGEKNIMTETDAKKVSVEYDIPLVKACQIVACAELGKRFYKKPEVGLAVIRTPKDVFDHVRDMRDLPKEHLRGIYLDTHNRVIHEEYISIGTINSNIVHAREVFRAAIEYNAAAIVLVHNHPSGIVTPSDADFAITNQLIAAGRIVGINVLDHIIVTKTEYQSIEAEY